MILKNILFDFVGCFLDLAGGDGPFVAGLLQAGEDFVSVVRNPGAVFLYYV